MNRPLTNLGLFLVAALAIAPPTPLNAQHTATLLNGDRRSSRYYGGYDYSSKPESGAHPAEREPSRERRRRGGSR